MDKKIYGVDLSKQVTPKIVMQAIFTCFRQAHKEVLDLTDELSEWASDEEREKFKTLEVEVIIKNAFEEANANYENPTKIDIMKGLDNLAKFALQFRNQEIVKKHYGEIMQIVEKLD